MSSSTTQLSMLRAPVLNVAIALEITFEIAPFVMVVNCLCKSTRIAVQHGWNSTHKK